MPNDRIGFGNMRQGLPVKALKSLDSEKPYGRTKIQNIRHHDTIHESYLATFLL